MKRTTALILGALGLFLAPPPPAPACSLCGGLQAPTFRLDAAQPSARMILYGPIRNNGTDTELAVEQVLRTDPALGGAKTLDLKRYVPVNDPKNPPHYLVFCDVDPKGGLDPYRGVPLTGKGASEYVKKVLALDPKDAAARLAFYFDYLENEDKAVAQDAFLEFARATDQEIGQASGKLSAERLRGWLKDEKTPPERLSLYAFLLGGCGGEADASFLRSMLNDDGERVVNAYDGFLGGYVQLRPKEGWELAETTLRDGRRPLPVRLAAVRTVRLYHNWKPKETREPVLRCLRGMLAQGELADVAVEDLRRWGVNDLTSDVLALYGKKGYDAPIMQRAIMRYAASREKDDEAARRFMAERRRAEPDLVKEVEESLQFEK
jgi:hypothetical protein